MKRQLEILKTASVILCGFAIVFGLLHLGATYLSTPVFVFMVCLGTSYVIAYGICAVGEEDTKKQEASDETNQT